MKYLIHLFIGLLLLGISGCRRERSYSALLQIADTMADTNAVAAQQYLALLAEKFSNADEGTKARYELLRVKAKVKAYEDMSDDERVTELAGYFERKGSVRERMMAYYYCGTMERDRCNYPEALRWFYRASDLGEAHISEVDTLLLSRIYSHEAWTLQLQNNLEAALRSIRKSYELEKSRPSAYTGAAEVASTFYAYLNIVGDSIPLKDSAQWYYREVFRQYDTLKKKSLADSVEIVGICAEVISFCNDFGCSELRDEAWTRLSRVEEAALPYNALFSIGSYFWLRERVDSAKYYWVLAERKAKNTLERNSVFTSLFKLYAKSNSKDSALHYAICMAANYDTLANQRLYEQTVNAHNEYVSRKRAERDAAEREGGLRRKLWNYVVLSVLLFALGAFALRNRQQRLRHAEERLALLRAKDEIEGRYRTERQLRHELAIALPDAVDAYRKAVAGEDVAAKEKAWVVLCASVEEVYPEFASDIAVTDGVLSPKEMALLYLLRAGMSQADIARMEGQSRQTVHSRVKALETRLGRRKLF
ncbi:MAG: winged helix-turn-helix transcriptional regulator [Alloprevotella sp.]|nr:winged helix-turn-helix transcriptional regulator [Alloprevotella sp.]